MNNKFVESVETTPTYELTENNGLTYDSSMDHCVDLFFLIGAARKESVTNVVNTFERAYNQNREIALRILLWSRDIRSGAGERQTFRNILTHLEKAHKKDFELILPYVPYYGRWDDLFIVETEKGRELVAELFKKALQNNDQLAAKWGPRKGYKAKWLREKMGFTPKQYRKTLVNLTNVVENKMCEKRFEDIVFSHVPSIAAARYKNCFYRHVPKLYQNYVNDLVSGNQKINASAIFPHDVIKEALHFSFVDDINKDVIIQQWDSLSDYIGDNKILPMVDVSGSMYQNISKTTSAIDISVSLGMYISEKNKGIFNGLILTFSGKPKLEKLTGNVIQRLGQLKNINWGFNTNVEKAFDEVLRFALTNNVPKSDMPEYLVIISDMEFDSATRNKNTSFENAKKTFNDNGYDLPVVVFWNLKGRVNNVPVTKHTNNSILISGFSPTIMKNVLSAKNMNSYSIMIDTIMDEKYNIF